jgi:ubiquinol-cytochrome c reductase cytochrome c subunit
MKRALVRWFTRPSRVPRAVRMGVALVMGCLTLVMLAGSSAGSGYPSNGPGGPNTSTPNPPTKSPDPPGAGNLITAYPTSPQLVAEGRELYNEHCSSCHGFNENGIQDVAPSLRYVGPGPVDFYVSTGRMPLENPRDEPLRTTPMFNRQQTNALIAYVTRFGGPPAPRANPAAGNLAYGQQLFTLHCAGCHQEAARGGMFIGAFVPNLLSANARQIAEAIRMGPYLMPHFDAHQIDQHALDSLVRYVLYTHHIDNAGGWGIYNIGPIPEGMVAWFLGLGTLLIVARLIGERQDEDLDVPPPPTVPQTNNGG